jgi:hypothetical protein
LVTGAFVSSRRRKLDPPPARSFPSGRWNDQKGTILKPRAEAGVPAPDLALSFKLSYQSGKSQLVLGGSIATVQ